MHQGDIKGWIPMEWSFGINTRVRLLLKWVKRASREKVGVDGDHPARVVAGRSQPHCI